MYPDVCQVSDQLGRVAAPFRMVERMLVASFRVANVAISRFEQAAERAERLASSVRVQVLDGEGDADGTPVAQRNRSRALHGMVMRGSSRLVHNGEQLRRVIEVEEEEQPARRGPILQASCFL